ncbi:MAG: hypothetical protein MUF70_09320, partial [Myxococcota bacterium]|nr:hypothetical protein [Myxococcota bacterium]
AAIGQTRPAPPRRRRWLLPAAAGATAAAAAALYALLQPAPATQPIASDPGVTIVADASEPQPVPAAPFARELDAREFAGRGASAPADDAPPAAAQQDAIDPADAEVVALLDVLDPEPRELRGSLPRDARNQARWRSLPDAARESLREALRSFRALAPEEQAARLRERTDAP